MFCTDCTVLFITLSMSICTCVHMYVHMYMYMCTMCVTIGLYVILMVPSIRMYGYTYYAFVTLHMKSSAVGTVFDESIHSSLDT